MEKAITIIGVFKHELKYCKNKKDVINKFIPVCIDGIEELTDQIQQSFNSIRSKEHINHLISGKIMLERLVADLLLTGPNISNDEALQLFLDSEYDLNFS